MVGDQHRTIADVARELGVDDETLGSWVCQECIDRGEPEGLTTAWREEPTRLGRQVTKLTMERELAKRAMAHSCRRGGSEPVALRSPAARPRGSQVAVPARAMGLSRQAYDAWRARAQRGPALCRPQLIAEIRAIAAPAPGHLRQSAA